MTSLLCYAGISFLLKITISCNYRKNSQNLPVAAFSFHIIICSQIKMGKYMSTYMFSIHTKYYKIILNIDVLSPRDNTGASFLACPVENDYSYIIACTYLCLELYTMQS